MTITTGTWLVEESKAAAFVEAWVAFAAWSSAHEGAGTLRLGRDPGDPRRFVSFAPWDTLDAVHAWKANPERGEQMARVLQHVADFQGAELELVASATDGDATVGPAAGDR